MDTPHLRVHSQLGKFFDLDHLYFLVLLLQQLLQARKRFDQERPFVFQIDSHCGLLFNLFHIVQLQLHLVLV